MSEWSGLPNASHIDWVISSVRSHLQEWAAAWDATQSKSLDAARIAAWYAAQYAARNAALSAARDAAWNRAEDAARAATWYAAQYAARNAAWDAVSALVAYDHAGKYFDMPSDQVRVWVVLSEEPAAILMLSAVILREQIEQVERV